MTIAFRGSSTAFPGLINAGAQATDLSVLTVGAKPFSATITTPSGWTKIGEGTDGSVAQGVDTGSMKVAVYVKVGAVAGSSPAVTITGGSPTITVAQTYSSTSGVWDTSQFTVGGDSSLGADYAATGAAGIDVATDDWVSASCALAADTGTISSPTIAGMSGATLGTVVQRTNQGSVTGNDMRLLVHDVPVTAGSSSSAPNFGFTNTSSTSGETLWLRLREVVASNQTVNPDALGSDEAFGTPDITQPGPSTPQTVEPVQIYPAGVVGEPRLVQQQFVRPEAIQSLESVQQSTVTQQRFIFATPYDVEKPKTRHLDEFTEGMGRRQGRTVYRIGAVWASGRNLLAEQLIGADRIYYGGYDYDISLSLKTELEGAGYTVATVIA